MTSGCIAQNVGRVVIHAADATRPGDGNVDRIFRRRGFRRVGEGAGNGFARVKVDQHLIRGHNGRTAVGIVPGDVIHQPAVRRQFPHQVSARFQVFKRPARPTGHGQRELAQIAVEIERSAATGHLLDDGDAAGRRLERQCLTQIHALNL